MPGIFQSCLCELSDVEIVHAVTVDKSFKSKVDLGGSASTVADSQEGIHGFDGVLNDRVVGVEVTHDCLI